MLPQQLKVGKCYKKANIVFEYVGKRYFPASESKNPNATPVHFFRAKEEPIRSRCGEFSLTLCEILKLEEV